MFHFLRKNNNWKRLVVGLAIFCVLASTANLPLLVAQAEDTGSPTTAEQLMAERIAREQAEMAARLAKAEARRQASIEEKLNPPSYSGVTSEPSDSSDSAGAAADTGSGQGETPANTASDNSDAVNSDIGSSDISATNNGDSENSDNQASGSETFDNNTSDESSNDTNGNSNGSNSNQENQNVSNSDGNQVLANQGCPQTGCSEEKNVTTEDVNSTGSGSTGSQGGSSATNDGTGDDSVNQSTASSTDSATIDNNKDTTIDNQNGTTANSGDNTMEFNNRGEGEIVTGDSSAEMGADTTANTNTVSAGWSSGGAHLTWPEENLAGNSNTGDDSYNEASVDADNSLSIINRNNALINNEFEIVSNSGRNDILAGYKFKDGGIKTGDVFAKANIMNLINTNLVNSKFVPLVLNITDEWVGDLNLMQLLFERFGANFEGALGADALNMNTGEDSYNSAATDVNSEFAVNNENTGLIYNDIKNIGISGRNKMLSGYKIKDASLKTGAVNVTTNLFNFLNTNLVGAEWVVAVINVFGDWSGNLILPRPQEIFPVEETSSGANASASISGTGEDSLNQAVVFSSSDVNITNFNDAQIETEVVNSVNTGANKMHFGKELEEAEMKTGASKSQVNQMTLANRNVVGGGWFSSMFNILGEWTGRLVGLPGEALVQGTNNQFMITAEEPEYNTGLVPGGGANASASISGSGEDSINAAESASSERVTINNSNQGKIVNKVIVDADSGSNIMEGEKGKRNKIDTGSAKASTNIANFLNTNIIGGKVVNVVVNTFGKWQGDLSFGESVDLTSTLTGGGADYYLPGQIINYTLTVTNKGPETAENVEASVVYDTQKTEAVTTNGGEISGSTIKWLLGNLASGETRQISFSLKVKPDVAVGTHLVEAVAKVQASKVDRDTRDNSSRAAIMINVAESAGGGESGNSDDSSGSGAGTGDSDNSGSGSGAGNNGGGTGDTGDPGSDESPVVAAGDQTGQENNSGGSTSSSNLVSSSSVYLTKTNNSTGTVKPGSAVKYEIAVKNSNPNSIFRAYVYDKLTYNGKVILEKSWPLDEVYAWERLIIEYEVNIAPDAAGGQYVNKAYLSGFDARNNLVKSEYTESVITVQGAVSENGAGSISINDGSATSSPTTTTGLSTDSTNGDLIDQQSGEWQYVELNETREKMTPTEAEKHGSQGSAEIVQGNSTLLRYIPTAQAATTDEEAGRVLAAARQNNPKEKLLPIIYGLDLEATPSESATFNIRWWLWLILLLLVCWSVYQFWKDNQQNRQL